MRTRIAKENEASKTFSTKKNSHRATFTHTCAEFWKFVCVGELFQFLEIIMRMKLMRKRNNFFSVVCCFIVVYFQLKMDENKVVKNKNWMRFLWSFFQERKLSLMINLSYGWQEGLSRVVDCSRILLSFSCFSSSRLWN